MGVAVGRIVSASHVSWFEDGSEAGAPGPVQGATLPWFETATGAGGTLELKLHAGRGTWAGDFTVSGNALTYSDVSYTADSFITFTRNGSTARIARDLFDALEEDSGGVTASSQSYFSGQTGFIGDAGALLVTQAGSTTLAVMSRPDQAGVSVFRYDGGAQVTHRATLNDTLALNLAAPVGLASVTLGTNTYVYAASSGENGISAFRLNSAGQLSASGDLTAEDGLWVSDITQLKATTVDGQPFLLAAAAGSHSLTVIAVGNAGQMTVVDHLLDDRDTRFGGITVLETLVVGDRTYVAASGGDQGVSLLTLLPNGQLLHLAALEDTQTLGLGSINALSLSAQGGRVHLTASSESEAGLTHIVYVPGTGMQVSGTGGADTLAGGTGDDIVIDGAGADRLTGGAGADLFILAADDARDTIMDFEVGIDRVDLSAWDGLYSTLQLDLQTYTGGIDIRYGLERLTLRTADGSTLDMSDLLATDMLGIARLVPHADRLENQPDRSGTAEADLMQGNAQSNTLRGLAGDDQLIGMEGNDELIGGAGNDVLRGDDGIDDLLGGDGHDLLWGGEGSDTLYGGTGADTLHGEGGNDVLWGDSATDILYGGSGNDTLTGGTGADTLYGGDGHDRILSNTGVDLIYGGGGNDWISPGNGVDVAYGDGGNDTIIGRTGWDTLHGGDGDDALYGSEGRDALYGDDGHDYLSGGFGWDTLWGGNGNDEIYGNIGEDILYGEAGNDVLYGATGDDLLVGGSGDDELWGAQGRDTLNGGSGDDMLRGGTLGDTFIFEVNHGSDTVSGLEWLDQIHLSTALTGGLTDASAIVQTYGKMLGGDMTLIFAGGDRITFDTSVTEAELIDVLYTF